MRKKRPRVIGTTEKAVAKAEKELNFVFPAPFRAWLIENNGLGMEDVSVFPVFDERDPRKTFDSITRNFHGNWLASIENFADENRRFEQLLPFAEFGTGDYYCFDYGQISSAGEVAVVLWSHETGETQPRGKNFIDFYASLRRGEFKFD